MENASAPGSGKGAARPRTIEEFQARIAQQAEAILAEHRARFDVLLSVVARERGLAPAHFTGPNKSRLAMEAKREAILLAHQFMVPPLNTATVGLFLGVERASAYRLEAQARKRLESDPQFAARLEALRPRVREALAKTEVTSA